MKVLLVGEFSSLHKYLKEGLAEIGISDVTIFADASGWKKIGGIDIAYANCENSRVFGRFSKYFNDLKIIRNLDSYDVIQFVNTCPFSIIINLIAFKILRKKTKCFSLASAGMDYPLVDAYNKGKFDYYIFDLFKEGLNSYSSRTLKGNIRKQNDLYISKNVDVIIPGAYEYSIAYDGSNKRSEIIPFPINVDAFEYVPNIVNEKIVIFHGLNNEEAKGTKYIREALTRIEKKYPNDIEVIIDGHMPFSKYVEVMKRANVVIDQCLAYGYGINACMAMAQGKVVMAGARSETLDAFGVSVCPIIHIEPDVEMIEKQVEYVINNREKMQEWGAESRRYVELVHSCKDVAIQYVSEWNKFLEK